MLPVFVVRKTMGGAPGGGLVAVRLVTQIPVTGGIGQKLPILYRRVAVFIHNRGDVPVGIRFQCVFF